MATKQKGADAVIDLGDLNPKQKLFCQARTRYIAYGGARGGGKTHVSRVKAIGGALNIPGLRVLFIRREYPELEQTVIIPMQLLIPDVVATYNGTSHMFRFQNNSIIKFGHYGLHDNEEYQGQEWDWIFLDEATQFTEEQFLTLGACLRGATPVVRRMFLTCNPGGIGHLWVKRLFVDRNFRDGENPDDYTFIPATVDDNPQLLEGSPEYKRQLDLLPENVRKAWRYGDWDALAGTYFPEFTKSTHVEAPIGRINPNWRLYRAIDYGLDALACLWVAIDFEGRAHVYREVEQSGLIVSEAARLILSMTPKSEAISCTFAPTDLWSRQKDTGRMMSDIFAENGLPLIRASRERLQGWSCVKDWLAPKEHDSTIPSMVVGSNCVNLIQCMENIQHDEKNPDDVATVPHDITHLPDALRYFCISRTMSAEKPVEAVEMDPIMDRYASQTYDDFMCGGDGSEEYFTYGSGGW